MDDLGLYKEGVGVKCLYIPYIIVLNNIKTRKKKKGGITGDLHT